MEHCSDIIIRSDVPFVKLLFKNVSELRTQEVTVLAIEENKRILIEWSGYGTRTQVEWTFTPLKESATFVSITETGFSGNGDELVKQVAASTSGFT